MHRCLHLLEIVSLICQRIEKSSLPSFARVCKAFSDSALDVLWRHQDSLFNLLRCMPDGIWNEATDEEEDEENWSLNRPVLPSDWQRPLAYSRRVKWFTYDERKRPGRPLSFDFFESFRLCLPWKHLFPNIQTLTFNSCNEWSFQFMRIFLGPRLNRLTLGKPQSAAHLSLLPNIAMECPLLKTLEIQFFSKDKLDAKFSISALVVGLGRLESLSVPCLDNIVLEHVAQLPSLTSLTLQKQTALKSFPPSVSSNAILFPSLRSIDITAADNVDAIIPLLVLMAHAPMNDLTIDIPDKVPAKRIAALYSAIARYCPHSSLKDIMCGRGFGGSITIASSADTATYLMTGAQILPLTSLTNLTEVCLTPPLGFDLDDAIVADLAQAWPHLIHLGLFSTCYANYPSRVTLRGLLPLAQHCPHLRSLTLPLDATSETRWHQKLQSESNGEEPARRIQQISLGSLNVMHSPIGDSFLVAGFLSSVFPKLKVIYTDHVFHPFGEERADLTEVIALDEKWKAVEGVLPLLRRARGEERAWTCQ
ncbi:hypothetical protein R3P38DRAFT_2900956 [Favolaschia claudopus]|uniref:F-box domain-containing protein n=1 Tax=Favolaschia claudopus TaxID=2862362 RepID=A0AAW0CLA6_9AGAR